MNMSNPLSLGLGSLPFLSDAETRSISAENPTGEKGGGAKALVPDEKTMAAMAEQRGSALPPGFKGHPSDMLGAGWKVQPCIFLLPPGTTTLADIEVMM